MHAHNDFHTWKRACNLESSDRSFPKQCDFYDNCTTQAQPYPNRNSGLLGCVLTCKSSLPTLSLLSRPTQVGQLLRQLNHCCPN